MKRGRNNQRRRQGSNPNRALDSNGPDVRIRGTANQIHDKYQTLARDAQSAGDRVKAENYLQHAEHYYRVMKAMQPTPQPSQENSESTGEGEQPAVASGERENREPREQRERRPRSNGSRRDVPKERAPKENTEASSSDTDTNDAEKKAPDVTEAEAAPEPAVERKPARKKRARRTPKAEETKDEAVSS